MLTIQEMEIVKNTSGGMTAKASKLLALLDRKPDEMLPIFVQCLRDTKQNHVADILEGEGKSATQFSLPSLLIYHND